MQVGKWRAKRQGCGVWGTSSVILLGGSPAFSALRFMLQSKGEVSSMNSGEVMGEAGQVEVRCPCCGATLKIDAQLGRVIWHEAAVKQKKSRDHLDRAGDVLEKQAAQREAHFRESEEQEKTKADLLARKFEEALKRTRDVPVRPDLRDIDLD